MKKKIHLHLLVAASAIVISSCAPNVKLGWSTHVSAQNEYQPMQKIWERPFMPWMPAEGVSPTQEKENWEGLPIEEQELPESKPKEVRKQQTAAKPKSQKKKQEKIKKKVVTKPVPQKYPVPAQVPSKPGFVFSPYNNRVVDVTGLPSGTLVNDPQFPKEQKKFFRVP